MKRLFGMPGGGSNADLVEAAGRAGLPFTLAHTETASAFMASAQAEITGNPGACIATLGPGASSIMNGVANASLDRIPLIVITDCHPRASAHMQHQTLRHREIFASLTKFSAEVSKENFCEVVDHAIESVCNPPYGPVHLDISAEVTASTAAAWRDSPERKPLGPADNLSVAARQLLASMKKPVFLVGLAARTPEISAALRRASEDSGIPALITYKAKGVVSDRHPWYAGVLTNGALESKVLERADGFVAIGLDSVELLPRVWRFSQPVIGINPWLMDQKQVSLAFELIGDVLGSLNQVAAFLPKRTDWRMEEVSRLASAQREAMRPNHNGDGIAPHRVIDLTAEVYAGVRTTVDAGAHMFPVMSLWPADGPCNILISNGLSTMGFALPAAIGAALLDSPQPVLAFTGDGGLMMCLGELRTAARENLPIRVIVFDDGVLNLIKIKQIQRGYRTDGVTIGKIDWEGLAASLGVLGKQAQTEAEFRAALKDTIEHRGPVLIAASITENTYPGTMRALRG